MGTVMLTTGTERPRSQRYHAKIVAHHGRGDMTTRSMDIARTVLMEPDLSYEEVGNRFGVTRQRVGQIVRRLDVARRKKINAV